MAFETLRTSPLSTRVEELLRGSFLCSDYKDLFLRSGERAKIFEGGNLSVRGRRSYVVIFEVMYFRFFRINRNPHLFFGNEEREVRLLSYLVLTLKKLRKR